MSDNNQFEFRSKFKKILNDSNEATIIAGFEAFMRISAVEARSYLWRMTYSQAEAQTVMILLGIKPCLIQEDKIPLLRNELRSEYEKRNSDFLKADVPSSAYEAYENLLNKANNDMVLANVVFSRCYRIVFESSYIRNRVLFLLNCDDDKQYFGGLRQMGFNYYEAEYLKPYHKNIRELLDKLCAQEKRGEFDPEFFNAVEEEWYEDEPVQGDETQDGELENGAQNEGEFSEEFEENICEEYYEEISEEYAEDTSNEAFPTVKETDGEEKVPTVKYKSLEPSAVLNDKDSFRAFVENGEDLNNLVAIGQLGYDLNEVMAKKELIVKLVKASDSYAMVYKKLEKAEQILKEAIKQLLKS